MNEVVKTFTFDPIAKAIYIKFSDDKIAETMEYSEDVNLDLDKDGDLVGVEILRVKRGSTFVLHIKDAKKEIKHRFHVPLKPLNKAFNLVQKCAEVYA